MIFLNTFIEFWILCVAVPFFNFTPLNSKLNILLCFCKTEFNILKM